MLPPSIRQFVDHPVRKRKKNVTKYLLDCIAGLACSVDNCKNVRDPKTFHVFEYHFICPIVKNYNNIRRQQ